MLEELEGKIFMIWFCENAVIIIVILVWLAFDNNFRAITDSLTVYNCDLVESYKYEIWRDMTIHY